MDIPSSSENSHTVVSEPPPVSPQVKFWLVLSLIFLGLGVTLPIIIGLWMLGVVVGGEQLARPLDIVGALDDDWGRSSIGFFIGSVIAIIAIIEKSVRAFIHKHEPSDTPPPAISKTSELALGYSFFILCILLPIDRLDIVDIADYRFGSLMLGAMAWVSLIISWKCLVLWVRLSRWWVMRCSTRPVLAGMTMASAILLTFASPFTSFEYVPYIVVVAIQKSLKNNSSKHIQNHLISVAARGSTEQNSIAELSNSYPTQSNASIGISTVADRYRGVPSGGDPINECFEELRGSECNRIWQRMKKSNIHDVDDLIHESFLYTCVDRQLRAPESCRTFASKVKSTNIDLHRRFTYASTYINEYTLPTCPTPSPYDEAMNEEERLHLRKNFEDLPEREQTILTLAYQEEMTDREIAFQIGLQSESVRKLRRKAELDLRQNLKKCQ